MSMWVVAPLLIFTPLSFEIIKSWIAVSLEEWQKAREEVWGKYSKNNYPVHTWQMFISKVEKLRMLFMQGAILSVCLFQQKPFVLIYFFWKLDEESIWYRRNVCKVMNKILGQKSACSACKARLSLVPTVSLTDLQDLSGPTWLASNHTLPASTTLLEAFISWFIPSNFIP